LAICLLGIIGGIIVGLMGVVAAEGLDTSVRGSRDIRVALNELPLSSIPKISNSISRRRYSIQAAAAGISLLIVVPVMYLVVVWVVR
jgi:hypothetical protein